MDIYQRIKYLAEKKRIQQKEISKSLNVTTATVNNWFQGKTSMKAEQIPLIAKLLRVSIDDLFAEDPGKSYKPPEPTLDSLEDRGYCARCAEKDREIGLLNELKESQKKRIEMLEVQQPKNADRQCG